MKTTLLISIAAFTMACEGSREAQTDASAKAAGAGTHAPNESAAPPSGTSSPVTLVGCLQGPGEPGVTGTSGAAASDRARGPAAGNRATQTQRHGAAHTGPFVLTNAAVESGGASGAGRSGGPVTGAALSYQLYGLPADAQASVNKRVRVTGRLGALPVPTATNGMAAPRGAAEPAAPSTTGETSTREDVKANSTGVAGDATNHVLTVETVQVVAQHCGPQ